MVPPPPSQSYFRRPLPWPPSRPLPSNEDTAYLIADDASDQGRQPVMPQPTTRPRRTGHPGYSETLPRQPESAGRARRLVRIALTTWCLDKLADDAALVVSELVANAVRHAQRDSIRVVVERVAPRVVRVAVADFSRTLPEPCTTTATNENGRGLPLIAALAMNWGTDERRWGKVVWAELEGHE
ncbi:ATP-binding protein [Streptomyces seoulensis]|uniref:ATP-binding protein n=1 Tax=Streptomyces seoulensis TaxID=73044 RepID=UPI0036AF5FF6